MELRTYLEILKRHRWFIVEAVVLLGMAAALASNLRTPQYEATARVWLRPSDPAESVNPLNNPRPFSNDPDRYVSVQEDIVSSQAIAEAAAKSLRGLTAGEIRSSLSVGQRGASDVLNVSATDTDPERARDIANAVASSYIENRRRSAVAGLQRAIDDIEPRLKQLEARIAELHPLAGLTRPPFEGAQPPVPPPSAPGQIVEQAGLYAAQLQYAELYGRQQELLVDVKLKRGEAEIISAASTPAAPVSPKPKRDGVLGAFAGLALAAGISVLREQLDDRVRSSREFERLTGLPVLAELPYDEPSAKRPDVLATVDRPLGALAESMRSLRTSLHFLGIERPTKVIVVTSARPGEGKSLVAANLAAAYAQAGYRTRLVSGDLRRPRLSTIFGLDVSAPGLTDVITSNGASAAGSRVAVTSRSALMPTGITDLSVLMPGTLPPNPAELLGSRRMADLLAELSSSADMVVIDTPPVLAVTDAAVLAAKADGVVLVAAMGQTRREDARRAKDILAATGGRLLGVVVNKGESSPSYYYTSYGIPPDKRRWRPWRRRKSSEELPLATGSVVPDAINRGKAGPGRSSGTGKEERVTVGGGGGTQPPSRRRFRRP